MMGGVGRFGWLFTATFNSFQCPHTLQCPDHITSPKQQP